MAVTASAVSMKQEISLRHAPFEGLSELVRYPLIILSIYSIYRSLPPVFPTNASAMLIKTKTALPIGVVNADIATSPVTSVIRTPFTYKGDFHLRFVSEMRK